jgi:hypothetical protein
MSDAFSEKGGFGISAPKPYTINAGEASNEPVDLGRMYGFIVIACPDATTGAAPDDTLSIRLSYDTDSPMFELNGDDNEPLAPAMGSAGTFWRRYFVGGARRVQLVLDANATAPLTFVILGCDAGVQ